MVESIFSVFAIGLILLLSEMLWRLRLLRGERSRKLVHILTGTFIAFWPFYMSFNTIRLLALAMLLAVIVSRRLGVFRSIHSVQRRTWGELFFPIGVALVASIAQSKWIFAAAVLHLSLADGMAAVVGTWLKRTKAYTILGQRKTIAGTLTFVFMSAAITGWVVFFSPASLAHVAWPILLFLPIVAAMLENIAVYGTDDLLVPLLVVFVLNSLLVVG